MSSGEFNGAGAQAGTEIWRIENMHAVPWPEDKHGQFHTGDSYICLFTKETNSGLAYDLHFWLGRETSQDEKGVAAYKTVELDDSLGGRPVQYREVQDHESEQFHSYFKKTGGISYLEGGVDSGFNTVDRDAYDTRLLHLKGRRKVRVSHVAVTCDSLNHGDVFILDMGLTIFQWNGDEASKMEKAKGLEVATRIRDQERGARARIIILDDGRELDAGSEDAALFWETLGGQSNIKSAEEGGADEAAERSAASDIVLYKCSDAAGSMEVTEVGRHPLSRELLDTNDAFILDCGSAIFVWVGKGANADERKHSMAQATNFLETHGRPDWTPVTRVIETGETPLFKEKFADWNQFEAQALISFGMTSGSNIARVEQKEIDIAALHARQQAQEEEMVDDGSGELTVWRVEDFDKIVVNADLHGQFFAGDSYIILYTYDNAYGRQEHLIYFWQGKDSSQDEIGASALLAKQLDDEMGGDPVQVRVKQGREPNHFLALFKGRFIVHEGGRASGFANVNDADSYDVDGISLFHVRGTNEHNTRAIQVAEVAGSLNSNDCFVLETPSTQFIWEGRGASDNEKEVAANVASILQGNRDVQTVAEGSEPAEFWEALGGEGEYASFSHLVEVPSEPRLFQCSNASGAFAVEEIFNFDQDDLDSDDVMLLDTFVEVFVWLGANCNDTERKMAMETAVKYVDNATDGRSSDTSILLVQQGAEPRMFTAHFHGWDANRASLADEYERQLAELRANNGGGEDEDGGHFGEYAEGMSPSQTRAQRELAEARAGKVGAHSAPGPSAGGVTDVRAALADLSREYTYEELLTRPSGLDMTKLESYLSEAEFAEVFGMDRASYEAMPGWKKQNAKKAAKLF